MLFVGFGGYVCNYRTGFHIFDPLHFSSMVGLKGTKINLAEAPMAKKSNDTP